MTFDANTGDVTAILSGLNDVQNQAVTAPLGKLRVIAGAGSGKTRVLVHRIAWVVAAENASPNAIIAVTFTNKAAAEMRHRIEALLGYALSTFWVGTFHSICHRILRIHHERVGLSNAFQIIDRDDQLRLIKRIYKDLEADDSFLAPKHAVNAISNYKEQGKRVADLDPEPTHPVDQLLLKVYAEYEARCRSNHLVDFAELLLRTVELLRDDEQIRAHYQSRFRHVLVDEFQDTNDIQFALIQLLASPDTDLFIVGDDDQSIYGFRGANVGNILNMDTRYDDLQTLRLEQNYRSTGNILAAANAVIAQNVDRLGKNLWTESGAGDEIDIYQAINEYDEAEFVINRIKTHITQGARYQEHAILYRSNAQSRVFEEVLLAKSVPYRIYGGLRFFDRAEIKDALAYLRLAENPNDDPAFDRIVNVPTRGIGAKTLDTLRAYARKHSLPLLSATKQAIANDVFSSRAESALASFVQLISSLKQDLTDDFRLKDYVQYTVEKSGLREHYENLKHDRKEDKLENLDELQSAAEHFERSLDETDVEQAVTLFLTQAALDAGDAQAAEHEDSVQLMTLHSAKGLEFSHVFLVGVEEGLFPHSESASMPDQLEEERRLAYVGITRAEQKLHITYAEQRQLFGQTSYPMPSRFINEIPDNIVNHVRGGRKRVDNFSTPYAQKMQSFASESDIPLGATVQHARFGEGVVVSYEGDGDRKRVTVNFANEGEKMLILAYAGLERVV